MYWFFFSSELNRKETKYYFLSSKLVGVVLNTFNYSSTETVLNVRTLNMSNSLIRIYMRSYTYVVQYSPNIQDVQLISWRQRIPGLLRLQNFTLQGLLFHHYTSCNRVSDAFSKILWSYVKIVVFE